MKESDILKDILQSRISNQVSYNNNLIYIRNPEVRQVYTSMRDDEMRSIIKLQQKIKKLELPKGIISRVFTARPGY